MSLKVKLDILLNLAELALRKLKRFRTITMFNTLTE